MMTLVIRWMTSVIRFDDCPYLPEKHLPAYAPLDIGGIHAVSRWAPRGV
jgi:hypothetical protein